MDVEQILSLLPANLLTELAIETKVNRYSKKLQGEVIFKLLLHCLLSHKDNSLRVMESAYESMAFNLLNADNAKSSIRYSSISESLSTINAVYFEKLYQVCVDVYGKSLGESSSAITRFERIFTLQVKILCWWVLSRSWFLKWISCEQNT